MTTRELKQQQQQKEMENKPLRFTNYEPVSITGIKQKHDLSEKISKSHETSREVAKCGANVLNFYFSVRLRV